GFDDGCFEDSEDQMIRTLLDTPHPFVRGISLEELEQRHFVRLRVPEPFQPFAEGGFGTPDGKCHFHADTLDYQPPEESRLGVETLRRVFPFELISPKNDDSMNSTFGHRDRVDRDTSKLSIHPRDAERLGIRSADPVRVFNDRGSCILMASVDDSV